MDTRDTVNADNPASLGATEETQNDTPTADQNRRRQERDITANGGDPNMRARDDGENAQRQNVDEAATGTRKERASSWDTPSVKAAASSDDVASKRGDMDSTRTDAASVSERPSSDKPSAQALVEPDRARDYRERWTSIQAVFVDQPKDAVEKADDLVEEVVRELTDAFGRERSDLEKQWSSGERVSTEQLRVALQRYRTFFEQLLSA